MKKSKLAAIQRTAFDSGYDSGYQDGYGNGYDMAYREVWKVAQRLCQDPGNDGYTSRQLYEIFGTSDVDWIISHMSAKDIALKLDEHDKKAMVMQYSIGLPSDAKEVLDATIAAFCERYGVPVETVAAEVLNGIKAS